MYCKIFPAIGQHCQESVKGGVQFLNEKDIPKTQCPTIGDGPESKLYAVLRAFLWFRIH
jgi:hypothetical protein